MEFSLNYVYLHVYMIDVGSFSRCMDTAVLRGRIYPIVDAAIQVLINHYADASDRIYGHLEQL